MEYNLVKYFEKNHMSLLLLVLLASQLKLVSTLHEFGGSVERKNGNVVGNVEYTYKKNDFSISGTINNRKEAKITINYDY